MRLTTFTRPLDGGKPNGAIENASGSLEQCEALNSRQVCPPKPQPTIAITRHTLINSLRAKARPQRSLT